MLAVIFGTKKQLNSYLKIVGFAYIGFLILTIFSMLVNVYFVPNNIPLEDFKRTFDQSFVHGWMGKSGEYIVLSLISLGIYNTDDFSFPQSIVVSVLPTVLLLVMKLLFNLIH